MNKAALKKHEIFSKLTELSERELASIMEFIDFLRHKKKQQEDKKIIKLEGLLKDHEIDFTDMKKLKEHTWKHVDEENAGG